MLWLVVTCRPLPQGRLPVKWMAPEALFDRIYTHQSDVWVLRANTFPIQSCCNVRKTIQWCLVLSAAGHLGCCSGRSSPWEALHIPASQWKSCSSCWRRVTEWTSPQHAHTSCKGTYTPTIKHVSITVFSLYPFLLNFLLKKNQITEWPNLNVPFWKISFSSQVITKCEMITFNAISMKVRF